MKTKVVYQTDRNGYYVGRVTLDDSDKSPRSGAWLIPGGCKEKEPPLPKEGYKIKWSNEKWIYEIIPQPEPEPEPSLEEIKDNKITELKYERDRREQLPIEYNRKTFDYDDKSRERLRIAKTRIIQKELEYQLWTCADNTFYQLTAEDIDNIDVAAGDRSTALHYQYNKLKILIASFETKEEVEAITFDTDASSIEINV